jgi:hypothetical protein
VPTFHEHVDLLDAPISGEHPLGRVDIHDREPAAERPRETLRV